MHTTSCQLLCRSGPPAEQSALRFAGSLALWTAGPIFKQASWRPKRDFPLWRRWRWLWNTSGTGARGPAAGYRSPASCSWSVFWILADQWRRSPSHGARWGLLLEKHTNNYTDLLVILNQKMRPIAGVLSEPKGFRKSISNKFLLSQCTTHTYWALWVVGRCQGDWVWWRWRGSRGRTQWWGRRGGPRLRWTDQPERRYWGEERRGGKRRGQLGQDDV